MSFVASTNRLDFGFGPVIFRCFSQVSPNPFLKLPTCHPFTLIYSHGKSIDYISANLESTNTIQSRQPPAKPLTPPTADCRPHSGGFVPDFSGGQFFVINQLGGFVFQKVSAFSRQSSEEVEPLEGQGRRTKEQALASGSSTFDLRPVTLRLPPKRWLRSSFRRRPVLCYQSTRWLRFSKKLSAFGHQRVEASKVQGRTVKSGRPSVPDSSTFDLRPLTLPPQRLRFITIHTEPSDTV